MPVSRDACLEFARRLNEAGFYTVGDVTVGDDPSKIGNPDRRLISLSEDYEVREWAQKFGVSEETLRGTVKMVGPQADNVAEALGMDHTPR